MLKAVLHTRTKSCHIGGLMRCCIETLDTTPVMEIDGETLQCKYTSDPLHNMIFRGGAWKWNYDFEFSKLEQQHERAIESHERAYLNKL